MSTTAFESARSYFLPPIPELGHVADRLEEAVNFILLNRLDEARKLIHATNMPVVFAFAARVVGPPNPSIHQVRKVPNAPPKVPPAMQVPPMKSGTATGKMIFARDGWRCRFCDCRVIPAEVRMKIDAILPQAIAWGKTNKEQHAGFQALWCTLDHVLPRSRGGTNDPANLVTACYMCQFGRAHFTLEEVGFADPRCREPVKSEWDGLTRLLTAKVQV